MGWVGKGWGEVELIACSGFAFALRTMELICLLFYSLIFACGLLQNLLFLNVWQ